MADNNIYEQVLGNAGTNLENDPVDQSGSTNIYEQVLNGTSGDSTAKPDTSTVSALKSAATGIVPSAGAWAGAESGAALGAELGSGVPVLGTGVGALGGGFIGAIIGSIGASKAQTAVLDKVAPNVEQQLSTDEQAHPIASTIGDIAASWPLFEFAPGETVKGVSALWKMSQGIPLDKAGKDAAMALAAQAGVGTAGAVVSPLIQGQAPDLKDIGISTLQALIMGKPRFDVFKTSKDLGIPPPPDATQQQQAPPPSGNQDLANQYRPPMSDDQKAELKALAGRQASNSASDEDNVQIGNITAGPDQTNGVHPDAPGFYQTALAEAKHKIKSDYAETLANQQWSDEGGSAQLHNPSTPNADAGSATTTATQPPSGPIADQVQTARSDTNPAPTPAQKEAGNYAKGQVDFDGLKISIENPLGSQRSGVGPDGKPWSVTMPADYGYIKGTEGSDGDHVDVSIGPNPDQAKSVFVIDQIDPQTGKFDETKSFIGFLNQEAALNAYRASFGDGSGDSRIGGVTEVSRDQFKEMATGGKLDQPLAFGKSPAWQSIKAKPDELDTLTEKGNAGVLVSTGKTGAGTKSAETYSKDTSKDALYKDSSAGSGKSRKLVALQSPDGSHVMFSGVYKTQTGGKMVERVVGYGSDGKPNTRRFDDLIKEGWKPLAGVKVDEPQKNFVRTYAPEDWRAAAESLKGKVEAGKRTAEDVSEKIAQGADYGRPGTHGLGEPTGDDVAAPHEFGSGSAASAEEFTRDHADAIFDAIGGVVKSPDDVLDAIKNGGAESVVAFQRAIDNAGLTRDVKTEEQAMLAIKTMANLIYDHYISAKKSGDKFAESFSNAISEGSASRADASRDQVSKLENAKDVSASSIDTAGANQNPGSTDTNPAAIGNGLGDTGANAAVKSDTGSDISGESASSGSAGSGAVEGGAGSDLNATKPAGDLTYQEAKASGRLEDWKAATTSTLTADGNFTASEARDMVQQIIDAHESEADENAKQTSSKEAGAAVRNRIAQAKDTILRSRPTEAYVARVIHNLVINLRNLGIDVRLLHESVSGMAKDCGKYEEWENVRGEISRAITVSLADTHTPTLETLKALLHEAAHAVFAKESPVMQARLHDAIEQATNERLGIGNFIEQVSGRYMDPSERARIAQEGRLAETVMQKLIEKGFDPATSSSVVKRIGAAVKSMYTRAAMAIQQAMGYKPSTDLALKYFENRMRLAITGSKGDSLISALGGQRVSFEDQDSMDAAQGYRDTLVRNRDIRHTSDQLETAVPGIANPTLEKQTDFVAENAVKNALMKAYDAFGAEGHNEAGLTPEQIVSRMGLGDAYEPGETPATRMTAANDALARTGNAKVDPNIKIGDIKNEAVRKQAAAKSIGALQSVRDGWGLKAREAKIKSRSAAIELEKNTKPLGDMLKNYDNIQLVASQAALRMQDVIQEQRDSFTDIAAKSDQRSLLDQTLRQLDSQIKGDALPQHYIDALNSLYSKLSSAASDMSFQDMLQAVSSGGNEMIDFGRSAGDIEQGLRTIADSRLTPLFENNPQSKALLATVISFAKKDSTSMDLLRLRQEKAAGERAEVNKALQLAMQKHSSADSEARAMVAKLSTLKVLGNKLLDDLKKIKARNQELVDEIGRSQKIVHFNDLASPIITQEIRPLESMIGALRTSVNIGPKTDVRIPLTATSKPEQFLSKTLSLHVDKDGSMTTQPEVRDAMTKMRTWLDVNASKRESLGADYNEIEATYNGLANRLTAFGGAEPIKQLWIAKFLAPTAERLRLVNTPMTRSLANMIENANSLVRKYRNDMVKHSHEWEVTRGDAMKALGYQNRETFKQCITDAFKDYSSKNHDLRAKYATNEDATNAAIKEGIHNLRLDSRTAKLLEQPGATDAVEKFFRKTVEVNAWRAKAGKEIGNKVYDPKLKLYRDVIGSEAFEFPRGLSDRADAAWKEMAGDWNANKMDPKKVQASYAQDKESLSEGLKERFTPKVWDGFMKWICYKDGASTFSTPLRADGTYDYASRDNVIKAYENSKDPITFAEMLYRFESQRGHGYSGDMSAFVGDTLHSIQSQWDLLTSMRGDVSENNNQRALPTPKRHIMDARQTDAGPREFYDYIDDDRSNLGNLVRSQAYNAALGRRLDNYYQTMAAAEEEQRNYVQQYDNLAADPSVGGKFKDGSKEQRKAVLNAAQEQGLNPKALREAHDNLRSIQAASRQMQGYLSQNQGRPPELSVFSELMSGIGSLTVSGPGTAFIAHTIAFENSLRKFGLNVDGLGMMADTARSSAAVAFRGFMQVFGHQMALNADDIAGLERNGLSNPNTMMKMSDQIKATYSTPDYVNNVLARGAIYAGRTMNLVASRVSAFHYLAHVIQLGNSVAWANKFKSVIVKGIEHFEANPQDRVNPNFKFKAKQLGVSEGRAFDYLQFAAGKFGIDIRQMIESAMDRQKTGKNEPLLTDEIYRKIAQLSLDDMTLESSPGTRPAFLMNNSLGQLSNPMLGWTLHKTYDVMRSMREPDGQRSANGFKTAMLAYAAILPMAMTVAYMRNKFDEDVAGKKQNVSDLSTIKDPTDAFLTMLDNASRVGTFGIAGEISNLIANRDNARPMSLDGRLFFLNTLENFSGAVVNAAVQRDADYQTVIRPIFQSIGGNGFYQYAGIINHALGLDNAESRTQARISVNNYLRVAGRQTNLDVRTYAGMVQTASNPTPWRPAIGNMVLSAYANDAQGFNDAKKEAIDRMVEGGYTHEAALQKVVQSFEDSNPLKVVFRSTPSQAEYQKMLSSMDPQGQQSVATAMRLFGHYVDQIGGKASLFGRGGTSVQRADLAAEKAPARAGWGSGSTSTQTSTGDDAMDALLNRARKNQL